MASQWLELPVSGGGGVTSLNSLTGALTLVAGSNITITPAGSNITIAATASGSGDVVGPGSSVVNTIPLFADTTGKLLKTSPLAYTTIGGFADALTNTNNISLYLSGNSGQTVGLFTTGINGNSTLILLPDGGMTVNSANIGVPLLSITPAGDVTTGNSLKTNYVTFPLFTAPTPSVNLLNIFSSDNRNLYTVDPFGTTKQVLTNPVNPLALAQGAGVMPASGVLNVFTSDATNLYIEDSSGTITQLVGASGSTGVFGPASSVNGNIVTWNGGSGGVIADSGVSVAALGPGGIAGSIQYNNSGVLAGISFGTPGNVIVDTGPSWASQPIVGGMTGDVQVNGGSSFSGVGPGTAGNVLTSNGTNWVSSAGAGPGGFGSQNAIQFNNNGVFGGFNAGTAGNVVLDMGAGWGTGPIVGGAGGDVQINNGSNGFSGVTPVADGTYTVGIGVTTNGTITTVNGIITAVQQAS